jgi:hypothetical protein
MIDELVEPVEHLQLQNLACPCCVDDELVAGGFRQLHVQWLFAGKRPAESFERVVLETLHWTTGVQVPREGCNVQDFVDEIALDVQKTIARAMTVELTSGSGGS